MTIMNFDAHFIDNYYCNELLSVNVEHESKGAMSTSTPTGGGHATPLGKKQRILEAVYTKYIG